MEMYAYAKIGAGNNLAGVYLEGQNELGRPAIPIYFEPDSKTEQEFLERNNAKEQGQLFFEFGRFPAGKVVVVIHGESIFLLEPDGEVTFELSQNASDWSGFVKLLPVKLLKKVAVADAPAVLAGLPSNRYYSSGTFRRISTEGNILAIRTLLGLPVEVPTPFLARHALCCLGSVEIETLVARLFEEAGCFVPAYRGGVIKNVDIFAEADEAVQLGGVQLEAGEKVGIQVKLRTKLKRPPAGSRFLVVGDRIGDGTSVLGGDWFTSALKCSPKTQAWLMRSLDWLPSAYLDAIHRLVESGERG